MAFLRQMPLVTIGGYIAVRIGARADMKAGRNAMRRAHAMQTVPRESPALFKCVKKIEAR